MSSTVLSIGDGAVTVQADPSKKYPGDTAFAVSFRISPSDPQPAGWVLSDLKWRELEFEKEKLIKAKVRAIIGTAVFGASFAIALGVIIGLYGNAKAGGGVSK